MEFLFLCQHPQQQQTTISLNPILTSSLKRIGASYERSLCTDEKFIKIHTNFQLSMCSKSTDYNANVYVGANMQRRQQQTMISLESISKAHQKMVSLIMVDLYIRMN